MRYGGFVSIRPGSGYRFDAIAIHIDGLVAEQQTLHAWPYGFEVLVERIERKISEAEVHHAWWRIGEQNAIREIGVLGHDDQVVVTREIPDAGVRDAVAKLSDVSDREGRGKSYGAGKILVEEKTPHATFSIVNRCSVRREAYCRQASTSSRVREG